LADDCERIPNVGKTGATAGSAPSRTRIKIEPPRRPTGSFDRFAGAVEQPVSLASRNFEREIAAGDAGRSDASGWSVCAEAAARLLPGGRAEGLPNW